MVAIEPLPDPYDKDVSKLANDVVELSLRHRVPVSYAFNCLAGRVQAVTFRLSEEAEWIHKGTCCICGKPASIMFRRQITGKRQWFCVEHGHVIYDMLEKIDVERGLPIWLQPTEVAKK